MSDGREYIRGKLQPLVDAIAEALRRRYPGVRIVEASWSHTHWGELRQRIRYQAPLEVLRRVGLVEDAMLERRRDRCADATELGDQFSLDERLDQASRPGCWDLTIWTGVWGGLYREHFSVRQAAQLLRRIAKCRHLDGS
jgi:hypothetical protein